nr:uncharacterized protein LOC123764041 [Procambarus clarkii]XP_045607473.1 uncharacterized protein LOC123764041 [Procambarus clarkii]
MDDYEQDGSELRLPELQLPEGLTADTLADLMTAVLLHQAYCQTDPWAQWLIVATVEIIHGRPVPRLDQEMLNLLQGIAMTENPERSPNSSHTYDQVLGESSSVTCSDKEQNPGMEMTSCKSEVDTDKEMQFKHNKEQKNISLMKRNESANKLAEMTSSNCLEGSRDVTSERKSELDSLATGVDVSVQISPRIMGIMCNKWIQVKKVKKIAQSSQTEKLLYKDQESQSEYTDHFIRLFENKCDKETQTMIIEKENSSSNKETQTMIIEKENSSSNKETQTLVLEKEKLHWHLGQTKASLNNEWQLIHMSGLPELRKHCSKTSSDNIKKKHTSEKKKHIIPCGSSIRHSSQKPLMNKYNKSVDNEERINDSKDMDLLSGNSDNSEISIPLFHGRPLIQSKSKMTAALIPVDPVSEFAIIMLEDPRCT